LILIQFHDLLHHLLSDLWSANRSPFIFEHQTPNSARRMSCVKSLTSIAKMISKMVNYKRRIVSRIKMHHTQSFNAEERMWWKWALKWNCIIRFTYD
jgi:hypothetical protein